MEAAQIEPTRASHSACPDGTRRAPRYPGQEELQRLEAATDKEQAHDLKIKTRVRIAKFALRGVKLTCSLIVLSMMTASLALFHATRSLSALNGFPPWAANTKTWPQKIVLAAACLSVAVSLLLFLGYCRRGHPWVKKLGAYERLFAIGWFLVNTTLWGLAAGVLQSTHADGHGQDLWGWSCANNERAQLFSQKINYALVCRLQNWSLVCIIIEIVLEGISIVLYCVVLYRIHSRRRLHRAMEMRNRARFYMQSSLPDLLAGAAPNDSGVHLSPAASIGMTYPAVPIPAAYPDAKQPNTIF
ncbi:hypothetical protein SEUCBS140593_010409 [Sporothrix eucalyptigena]|uniref:Uncharacterized protein n=1 Tax=Sporothrix eucalyptigena TaxID=1812306 RepID=A0ABP0D1A6_9PEZI